MEFFNCGDGAVVPLSASVRGAKAQGPRLTRDLNSTLPDQPSNTKEEHHGEEEEGQDESEEMTGACASYWGSAVSFGFREIICDLAKRPDRVRPLSFWRSENLATNYAKRAMLPAENT